MSVFIYKNKELKENIDNIKTRRKTLLDEIKFLDEKLFILQKTYNNKETEYYFDRGMCSCCQEDLSVDDIKCSTVYCESCREADSVLDWDSKLT
jgi:hypothetical protein